MSSVMKHRKRSHRSEKLRGERAADEAVSPRAGVTLPLGMGVLSAFGRHFLGRRRKREKQAAK